jgi:CO/xanthine dehydrogenase Mo-binding subunit
MMQGPRKEDHRLVRGRGLFVDDEQSGRQLHMKIVRSPYAHARLRAVDVSAAAAMPGVVATLTGDEVARLTAPFPQIAPEPMGRILDYSMATDRVRFQGEPVAAVVATSPALAEDAAAAVQVDYDALDVVVDAVEGLEDRTVLHERAGTNRTWQSVFEWGDVDGAFRDAAHVVHIDRLHFHRFSSTPLEPYAVIATWLPDDSTDFFCNMIQPGVAMKFMAPALGISPDRIRIRTHDIGGSFGIKQNLYPYLILAVLASRKCGGRPVKWIETRREHLQASSHGNERTFLDTEVALDADGVILGLRSRHVDDCGAYPRYEPLGCVIWSQVAPGPYRLRNLRIDFTQSVTNKCPVGPNRGFSRMQHLWFLERVIDICGHRLGIAPDLIRRRNYIDQMPYETPNGCVYDSGDYGHMLAVAQELIDWPVWRERVAQMRVEGRRVGIGIGTTLDSGTNNFSQSRIINPNSPFTGNSEAANVRIGVDGSVTVAMGTVPQGQGHETVAAEVVSSELCVPVGKVYVQVGFDTARNVHTGHSGTYASQFAVTGLSAIHGAVESVRAEVTRLGAWALGVKQEEVELRRAGNEGTVGVRGSDRAVSFAELSGIVNMKSATLPAELGGITLNCRHVYRPPFQIPDVQRKFGNLTLTYAAQLHIAVVEVDRDTHGLSILDYAAVDDCGRVINHRIVRGQVMGAAAHGLGAALMETLRYDEDGNLLTATFSDYCPITVANMPIVRYSNVESPSPFTYNGAKGMGEGGGAPLHAIAAALQDAFADLGYFVDDSHHSPGDLFDVLSAGRQGARVRVESRPGSRAAVR